MNELDPQLDITQALSPIDWVLFFALLALTFLVVIFGNKKLKSNEANSTLDLLIMGRKLTLPLFVGTLVATWYGGIFGVTQIAFEKGIYNFITQGVFWYLSYIIFALFLVDRVHRYQAVTLPDLVEKMFGPKSAKLSAGFNFFNVLPIAYCMSVGLFLQSLFGGELLTMIIIGTSIVLLYSLFGGLRAVVLSDMVQFFVMCSSVLFVLIFSVIEFGGSDYLVKNLPQSHFSPTGGQSSSLLIIWGFIALSTLVDPNFYQRCFAASSPKVAKKGILISTLIWIGFDICTTLGAMYARAALSEAGPQTAYLTYSLQVLPTGLKGVFLAGILATILSTLDSYLFVAGTTLSYDLGLAGKKNFSKKLYRIGTVSSAIVAVALSTIFDGKIESVWKLLGSYSASCLLMPMLLGHLFPRKLNDNSFFLASSFGVVSITFWKVVELPPSLAIIDSFYVGLASTGPILLIALARSSKVFQGQ